MTMKSNHNKIKIVITGGGSGGHVEPALAVAQVLQKHPDVSLSWIGTADGYANIAAKENNIDFYPIETGKIRRYISINNLSDISKTIGGVIQSLRILKQIKPDVVFSKSGFVSAPVVFSAKLLGIPVVIHESDIILGLTNRLLSRMAKKLCCGFPVRNYPNWVRKIAVYTGNPIQRHNVSGEVSAKIMQKYNLKVDTLLILGGSQGSTAINQLIWDELNGYVKCFNVVHQVGANNIEQAIREKNKLNLGERLHYHPVAYLSQVELAVIMAKSKLAVSRTGAGTITDLSFFKLPAILIPLPSSANDHGRANARYVEKCGGAQYYEQSELTGVKLFNAVLNIIEDKYKLHKMSIDVAAVNPIKAAEAVAEIILNEVRI
jgi:UDP-N-acetylglucosamine--N-acetylmuramyl-(pentapeptide) pyrophosphoryl-undecaprenol N-acetylglucosamine transferase